MASSATPRQISAAPPASFAGAAASAARARQLFQSGALKLPNWPQPVVWKTYGVWAGWVGIAFFSVYPTCNWLTAQRGQLVSIYIESELAIPFLPVFISPYLSLYLLFLFPPFFLGVLELQALGRRLIAATLLSGLAYCLLPTQLGFERVTPAAAPYTEIFGRLFFLDLPHNMVPSLHVVFSTLIILAIVSPSGKPWIKVLFYAWLILLFTSTLLIHQHHFIDIISGAAIAVIFHRWPAKGGKHA
jgi:hypothetical protein